MGAEKRKYRKSTSKGSGVYMNYTHSKGRNHSVAKKTQQKRTSEKLNPQGKNLKTKWGDENETRMRAPPPLPMGSTSRRRKRTQEDKKQYRIQKFKKRREEEEYGESEELRGKRARGWNTSTPYGSTSLRKTRAKDNTVRSQVFRKRRDRVEKWRRTEQEDTYWKDQLRWTIEQDV